MDVCQEGRAQVKPGEVLKEAGALIEHDRQIMYGSSWKNHNQIAALWSVILGRSIRPDQVAACMIAVKLSRLVQTPTHTDSWVDVAAYAALGHELAQMALTDELRDEE